MPDEDKNFDGSLVLDFGQSWRHVKTIYNNLPSLKTCNLLGSTRRMKIHSMCFRSKTVFGIAF